ncbi:hypothetical protein ACFOOK_19600 [Micromonospora krabiensis]|uniref:Uncharacterized protein n=1 Tax=Micromonospora krabiensis TaxID=307121 RepID=A0A1C3N9H0_9ACTN|nr:hypothetical protein [Micromonospora krabiensis]SBV29221.1 hypothetical protein GA0070620_4791 [Micromonospora krabiensis]
MRLTVGPLPPAVYWRRRAVVLGAGLLFLIVLLYSCTGSGNGDDNPRAGSTSSAGPGPTGSVLTPQTGAPPSAEPSSAEPSGAPEGEQTASTAASSSPPEAPPVAPAAGGSDDGSCTDAEISVIPVAKPATVQRGAPVDLQLKIKNTSDRTCSRDVGADLQELFIKSGAEKIWSSDTCGTGKGSDVQSFTPNFERSYQIAWNGQDSSRCANGVANGPNPPGGSYQVFARVGTKLSEPVKLTITG